MGNKKYLVLFSAGLDSTTNLYEYAREATVALALTFDYGQRARRREIELSQRQCEKLGIEHQVVELPWFKDFAKTGLVDHKKSVPMAEVDINSLAISHETAQQVWVPNRNGIFINIAAAYAESLGVDAIVPGFNREEAATFPDNSQEYLVAAEKSLSYSTWNQVKVECQTTHLDKSEIFRRAIELGVDFESVWACYFDDDLYCGQCESCQRFLRAAKPYERSLQNNTLFGPLLAKE